MFETFETSFESRKYSTNDFVGVRVYRIATRCLTPDLAPSAGVRRFITEPLQILRSRRPDSNRGPHHYEGKTSEGRAGTRGQPGHVPAGNQTSFTARRVDARARACPS
jgi:hypothetical protein